MNHELLGLCALGTYSLLLGLLIVWALAIDARRPPRPLPPLLVIVTDLPDEVVVRVLEHAKAQVGERYDILVFPIGVKVYRPVVPNAVSNEEWRSRCGD